MSCSPDAGWCVLLACCSSVLFPLHQCLLWSTTQLEEPGALWHTHKQQFSGLTIAMSRHVSQNECANNTPSAFYSPPFGHAPAMPPFSYLTAYLFHVCSKRCRLTSVLMLCEVTVEEHLWNNTLNRKSPTPALPWLPDRSIMSIS